MSHLPKILIVDDDNIHLMITGAMVKKIGFSVLTAKDGKQALTIFEDHANSIDCILLDMQMPVMNGVEFLQNLRLRYEEVQVIIVSGYLNNIEQKQLDSLNPACFLKKPLDFDVLLEALKECVGVEKILQSN